MGGAPEPLVTNRIKCRILAVLQDGLIWTYTVPWATGKQEPEVYKAIFKHNHLTLGSINLIKMLKSLRQRLTIQAKYGT